jgi:hypothetical protein
MADPIVHITAGLPDLGTGNITTLGLTIPPAGTLTSAVQGGPMAQGAVTTGLASYTNGQVDPLSLTTTGLLRVDGSNVTQPISGSITVSGTTTVSGTVTANQGGTWTVQPGNTANTTAWLVTGTGGTFPVTGTVTANQGGTWNINNVSGTISLPTGAATSANQPSAATSGSTSSGQTGTVAMGFTTTGAPTYTTAQTNPLSLTTAGALRVDGSAVTQPVSGTFWQATQPVSGTVTVTQGTAANLNATVTGTVAATQSGTWTVQPGNTANTTAWLVTGTGGTFPVTGTFWQTTQPVSGTVTANQGGAPWSVNGDTASGVADANNPIKIGGVARTSNPAAVTNGQRVNGIFDKLGKQVVVGALRDVKGVQKTSITATTETTVVTAGGANVFNDVYAIIVTNTSATGVSVDFRDATAGTIRMTLYAPATDTRGFTVPVDSAMVQAVANNNWTATASGAVSSLQITVLYVSNL